MTKNKRFTIKEFSTLDAMSSLDVICDKGIELPSSTACDLLNEQHEELGNRKQIIKAITNEYIELEQAKNLLLKENEQLKQQLKVYHKLASCSNCKYHDYDTLFGDGEEYEVCDKGNDVTDRICIDWREL